MLIESFGSYDLIVPHRCSVPSCPISTILPPCFGSILNDLAGLPLIIDTDRLCSGHQLPISFFGGVAFLLNGNMCCGIHGEEMIVRLNPEETDQALARPHTRIFDMTGRPMKGWILVKPAGVAGEDTLAKWVSVGVSYVASLPAKKSESLSAAAWP